MWILKLTSEQVGPRFWMACAAERVARARRISLVMKSILVVLVFDRFWYEKEVVDVEGQEEGCERRKFMQRGVTF